MRKTTRKIERNHKIGNKIYENCGTKSVQK